MSLKHTEYYVDIINNRISITFNGLRLLIWI